MRNSNQGRGYSSSYNRERDSEGRYSDNDDYRYGGRGNYETAYDEYDDDEDEDDDYGYARNEYDYDDEDEEDDDDYYDDEDYEGGRSHSGRQGFASMSRDEVRRIASMGGRASHGGGRNSGSSYESRGGYDSDYERSGSRGQRSGRRYEDDRDSSRGRQGFASMDRDEVRRIASMGGRASHGGRGYDSNYGGSRSNSRSSYSSQGGNRSNGGRRSGGSSRSRSGNGSGSGRGFASMSHDEVVRIARKGGRARARSLRAESGSSRDGRRSGSRRSSR